MVETEARRGAATARRLAALVALALALAVGACGSEDGASGTPATADGGEPARGGTLLVALVDEPGLLNPLFNSEAVADLSLASVIEPLFARQPDGTYEPQLAAEIPTVENGGVSKNGKTVIYRLREGVTWSDGEPFTAGDIEFTYDVITDPESTPVLASAYGAIASVKAVDDLTVRVRMTEPNPRYLDLWEVVLPEHALDSTAVTTQDELAQIPLGTGPFVIDRWNRGDSIVMKRNPSYWRDLELPYLDGITFKVSPDEQTAVRSFVNGEFDTVFYISNSDLPEISAAVEGGAPIQLELQESPSYAAWLWLNHSGEGSPLKPNPVLSDPAVRQAIDLSLDRQSMIDDIVDGFGTKIGSFIYTGFAAHPIEPAAFDPERAKQLLDEAGWVPGGDGIRAQDGVPATLEFTTVAGDQTYELIQQLVRQNLRDVGIDVRLRADPLNRIFAGYQDGGVLANRQYDLMMSLDGYYSDPADFVNVFTTASIPTAENPNGFSYTHLSDERYDALAAEAASTVDPDERVELYAQIAERFAQEDFSLPLYASEWGWAWSTELRGVTLDSWDGQWNNPAIAEWHLAR